MAVAIPSQRLVHPPRDAQYSVEHVDIPITGLGDAVRNHADGSRWKVDGLADPTRIGRPAPRGAIPGTIFHPANPTGAWVLMICGAGDNRVAFKWLIVRSFMALGITVMSIDPPGHGDFLSVPATAHNVRVAAQAASHWLHRRSDVRRTGAMGISFGGCQAAGLCAEDERISALATISAPVELPHVTKSVVVREALSLVLPRNAMVLRHASWPQIWGEWKSMRGAWFGESLYEMIKSYDMLNTVRAIGKRPTLFIHGAADVAVPPVNAQRLYDAALPQRELMLVPQATHITVALQAREIARMAQWFSKHLA